MKWIVAIMLGVVLLALLPLMITRAKKSTRGRLAGATFIIGLAFGAIFDPAKAAAIENIQKKMHIGDAEHGGAGETLE